MLKSQKSPFHSGESPLLKRKRKVDLSDNHYLELLRKATSPATVWHPLRRGNGELFHFDDVSTTFNKRFSDRYLQTFSKGELKVALLYKPPPSLTPSTKKRMPAFLF